MKSHKDAPETVACRCGGEGHLICLDTLDGGDDYFVQCEESMVSCPNEGPHDPDWIRAIEGWNDQESGFHKEH